MRKNRIFKLLTVVFILIFTFNSINLSVFASDQPGIISGNDMEEVQIQALVHTKYGGLVKRTLILLKGEDSLYISAGQMADIGLMNGGYDYDGEHITFIRNVTSIIDLETTLDTIERTYTGNIVDHFAYLFVNMMDAFELLEVNHYFDGDTIVIFPRLYLDDEYSTVLDEIFTSNEFSIDTITGAELLGAEAYADLRDFSIIGLITGSTYVDRYSYVLTQMLMPDATIKTKSQNIKELQGAQEWAELSLTYGEMAETCRADIFTGFGYLADRAHSYDATGAFLNDLGIGKGSWVSDVISDGEDINRAIGYAMTYQNAQQVADLYSDSLYYGVVQPGGDNNDYVYTQDTIYLTRAANYVYNEMDGTVSDVLSYNVMEDFLSFESNKYDNKMLGYLTDYEFYALKKAVMELLEVIGADQEIQNGLNTVICDNICERSQVSYYNNRNVDNKAMKYCAIMYLLSSKYYCDLYDDYPTMIASISGWKQSDSQMFYNQKIKAQEVISRIAAIDDIDSYVSSSFSYYIHYNDNDIPKEAVISGYKGNASVVTIPSTIMGVPVKYIASDSFKYNNYIKKVILPDSIEYIGNCAFYECSSLEEINLPNSLTEIGFFAFYKCSSLKEISIPQGVKTLEKQTFYECTSLNKVELHEGLEKLEDGVFLYCSSLETINIPNSLTTLEGNLQFKACESLKSITLPSIQEINYGCFSMCSSLETANFPALKTIHSSAFYGCTNLKNLIIPNVINIEDKAFENCGFEVIDAPCVQNIGCLAFKDCDCLTDIYLPSVDYISLLPFTRSYNEMDKYSYINIHLTENIPQLEDDELLFGMFGSYYSSHESVKENGAAYGLAVVYVPCTVYDEYLESDFANVSNVVLRPEHIYESGECCICGMPEGICIDRKSFPDSELRRYISEIIDIDQNGILDNYEIKNTKTINHYDLGLDIDFIYDYKGIEIFTNLENLCYVYYGNIDLSYFPKLKCLLWETIAEVDINNNPYLKKAYSQGIKYTDEYDCIKYVYHDNLTGEDYILEVRERTKVKCNLEETHYTPSTTPSVPTIVQISENTVYSGNIQDIDNGEIEYYFTPSKSGYYVVNSYNRSEIAVDNSEWAGCITNTRNVYILESGTKYRLISYSSDNTYYKFDIKYYDFDGVSFPTYLSTGKDYASVLYGENIAFSVNAGCYYNAAVDYVWYDPDSGRIYGTKSSLNINSKDVFSDPNELAEPDNPVQYDYPYDYMFIICEVTFDYGDKTIKRWEFFEVEVFANPDDSIITINYQPEDYVGPVGDKATFHVDAEGNSLNYQWQVYKNGAWKNTSLTGCNSDTLEVDIIESRNLMKFRCVITDNKGKSVTSDTATLKVSGLTIKTQPADYTGPVGENATFKITASGEDLTYQWQVYKNATWKNTSLPGNNMSTLTVGITESRNGMKFRCVVTDKYGNRIESREVTLTTSAVTLKISVQPKDFEGAVGDTAVFSVKTEGQGLKYQWQVFKSGVWKNTSLPGNKTDTLNVEILESRDGMRFRCVVTDGSGNSVESNGAAISIASTPVSIYSDPEDYSGAVGDIAVLSLEAEGEGLTYQWQVYKNGVWKSTSLPGNKTDTLSVELLESRDGMRFRCVVTDVYGNSAESEEAAISIAITPVFIYSEPDDYSGPIGDTAIFLVGAEGDDITYQWQVFKNGVWKNTSLTGNTSDLLEAEVLSSRDGMKFRCVVTDKYGNTAVSEECSINVMTIDISIQPEDYSGGIGEKAEFYVEASGEDLTYQWQVFKNGAWKNTSLQGNTSNTLIVELLPSRNGMMFRCVITDANGNSEISYEVELTVIPIEITLQPQDFEGVIGDKAVFTVEAEGEELTYQWQVYKNGDWKNTSLVGNNTSTLAVDVTAARDGFIFRCIITNADGESINSSEVTITVNR